MKLADLLKKIGVELTEEQTLKYEALEAAEKDLVPRSRINDKNKEIEDYQKQLDDIKNKYKDSEKLQKQLSEFEQKLETSKKEKEDIIKKNYMKEVASKFKAKDMEDLFKFVDHTKIKIENDTITGLEDQITELKTKKSYLFEAEQEPTKENTIKGAVPAPSQNNGSGKPVVYTKEQLSKMSPEEINANWDSISKQLGTL